MELSIRSGKEAILPYSGYATFLRRSNDLVTRAAQLISVDGLLDHYDLEKASNAFDTTTIAQKNMFEMSHANLSILRSLLEQAIGAHQSEIEALSLFVQVNLRRVLFEMPDREIQVQNGLEQLLIGRGYAKNIDYGRETGRVKISVKEVVPDFVLLKLGMAVEVKLVRDKVQCKAVVDEINADIQAYGKAYPHILFVVYDLGAVRDEGEFKAGLTNGDAVNVIVVKH